MTSVYHIVTIRVNETSWAHVWRLRFRYLGTGYDNKLRKKQGGMCYTTKCDMVEDGLTERASEGNPGE
jgi:hypothetical protein